MPRRGSRGAGGLVIEGYTDLVEIGAGTSATVYRAFQEAFQRQVALKVLTADVRDQRAQKRFISERSMTGRLSRHPNVITVYDSGFAAGRRPYLAMEYFASGSYANVIDAAGPLAVPDALRVGVKIAGALESAHRAGVIHRDIKPQNVLLSGFGEPVLADFGLAVTVDPEASFTAGLTPAHAAPELLEGSQPSVATDLYALGSTLYTLLAGQAPFAGPRGEGLLAQFRRIAIGDVPPIPRADLPDQVMRLLRKALATAPTDRFRTAAELGRALQNEQSALGLPVTDLVLEAETAMAPTSRSLVDTRSVEETATRGAAFAPAVPPAPPAALLPRQPLARQPLAPQPLAPPPLAPQPLAPQPLAPPPLPMPLAPLQGPPTGTPAGVSPDGATLAGRAPTPPREAVVARSRRTPVVVGVSAITLIVLAGGGLVLGGVFDSGHAATSTSAGRRLVPVRPSVVPSPTVAGTSPAAPVTASPADSDAPTGLRAQVTGKDQVTLNWQDHTGGSAGQYVLVSVNGAAYTPERMVARGTTSAVITATSASAPTCYRVFAAISIGRAPGSPPVCINGGSAPTASPSP